MTYRIRIERNFYGPRTEVRYLTDDSGWTERRFAARREAEAEIEQMDAGTYYLAHSEYERPTYRVVRVR